MSDMEIKVILEEANVNKDFFTSNRKENNLKCPFCQQELRSVIQQEGENTHTTWHCPKCELGKYKWACGNKTLWQALIDSMKEHDLCHDALVERTKELERTRKALGYAIDVIQTVAKMSDKLSREYGETFVEQLDNIQAYCWQEGYVLTHEQDLERAITALEQKDVKCL